MSSEQWERVWDLFDRAVAVDQSARCLLLDRQCEDRDVRAALDGLLAEDDALGDSLLNRTLDSLISPQLNPAARHLPGAHVGLTLKDRYTLERYLDSGGTGIVYMASDRVLPDKQWVVKILREGELNREWFRKKFSQEIRALTLLDGNTGIVAVSDAGELQDGVPYFVMPYVEGTTLRSRLQGDGLSAALLGEVIRQVSHALNSAHTKSVYHLDIKPSNIILQQKPGAEFQVCLIDFGIAKIRTPDTGGKTEVTRLAGTPGYMAPEQFVGRPTAASDVYALGVIAFEALTGRRPSPGDCEKLEKGRLADPVPKRTQRLLASALAVEQRARPQAATFGERFARSLAAEGSNAPDAAEIADSVVGFRTLRLGWRNVGVAALLIVGASAWLATRGPDTPALVEREPTLEVTRQSGARAGRDPVAGPLIGTPGRRESARPSPKPQVGAPEAPSEAAVTGIIASGAEPLLPPSAQDQSSLTLQGADASNLRRQNDSSPSDSEGVTDSDGATHTDPKPVDDALEFARATPPVTLFDRAPVAIPQSMSSSVPPVRDGEEPDPVSETGDPFELAQPLTAPKSIGQPANSAVLDALRRYETAFEQRDIAALRRVWPSITATAVRALEKTFADNESVAVDLDEIDIVISDDTAVVTCNVIRTFVPTIGRSSPQTFTANNRFLLRSAISGWIITAVAAV